MGSTGLMPASEAYPKAKDLTLKAIELDPEHAESHLSLAAIKFYHNWDFDGAEASLNKVQNLGLNSSLFNQVLGWFLIAKGDFEKAIEKMQQAVTLDPLSLPLMSNLADAYSFAGRFEEALLQYDKIVEMDSRYRRGFEGRGMIYLALKDYEKAIKDFEQYHQLIGHPLKGLSALGHAYAAAGDTDKAMKCLEGIQTQRARRAEVAGVCVAKPPGEGRGWLGVAGVELVLQPRHHVDCVIGRDVRMDDRVTQPFLGILTHRLVVGIDRPVDAAITDGVHRDVHSGVVKHANEQANRVGIRRRVALVADIGAAVVLAPVIVEPSGACPAGAVDVKLHASGDDVVVSGALIWSGRGRALGDQSLGAIDRAAASPKREHPNVERATRGDFAVDVKGLP